jgi:hypothetical protein
MHDHFPKVDDRSSFCCQFSQNAGENLFASVKRNRVWFLLEYPYLWGEKAFEESDLDEPVKDYLDGLLNQTPDSKLLFIKNQDSLFSEEINFFVGISAEINPRLYRFQVDDYSDLLSIDLARLLSGKNTYNEKQVTEPVFLVCTNGKRDPCCAKFGLEVYNQLTEYVGGSVWQSTHVGGHRFAANVVCFPHAIYYGRFNVDEAKILLETYPRSILLDKYRGRACYTPEVQAADYYLRDYTNESDMDAFRHIDTHPIAQNQWSITFSASQDPYLYKLKIRSEPSESPIYKGCRDEQPVYIDQYRLVEIRILEDETST